MGKDLCGICCGDEAVVSPNVGSFFGQIWCPICNLEMYLVESGIVGRNEQGKESPAIGALNEELARYISHGRITKEQKEDLVKQAYALLSRIQEDPRFGAELLKKSAQYYKDFREKQVS